MVVNRKLILLVGIGGAGKSTVAFRLARRLSDYCYLYSEDSQEATESGLRIDFGAFNRAFVENVTNADAAFFNSIVEHCFGVIRNFPAPPRGSTIIVDRWYDTYVSGVRLPSAYVNRIEDAIVAAGIEGYMVNLVVDDDEVTMIHRLEHTRAHRPPEWWEDYLGTAESRVSSDLKSQRDNRMLGLRTAFNYLEVNTTTMDWDSVANKILQVVQPRSS